MVGGFRDFLDLSGLLFRGLGTAGFILHDVNTWSYRQYALWIVGLILALEIVNKAGLAFAGGIQAGGSPHSRQHLLCTGTASAAGRSLAGGASRSQLG